jgi:galactose-1-phosphate uridylyltransferase
MNPPIDSKKTLEVIERMKLAKIGEYNKWEKIIKKIKNEQPLNPGEVEYYTNLTRIYKDSKITSRSKIYHTKLSELDEKPPCKECGKNSLFYCNMNDQYFCSTHVVGHDENEF